MLLKPTVLNNRKLFFIIMLAAIINFQNCSNVNFATSSPAEQAALSAPVFDPNQNVAGIDEGNGYPSENLRLASISDVSQHFVKNCSKTLPDGSSRYNSERQKALAAAAADPTLIPVEFAVSFGTTNDTLALWAHQRAILTDTGDDSSSIPSGTTYIPVGDKGGGAYSPPKGGSYQAYYEVDHTQALSDYRWGTSCFFDVVKVKGDIHLSTDNTWQGDNGETIYPFINKAIPHSWNVSSIGTNILHAIHYMYFGYCDAGAGCDQATNKTSAYGAGSYGADMYPNRLFGALPHLEVDQLNSADPTTGISSQPQPQIVKLYVADLRNSQITNGGNLSSQSIIPKTDLLRGQEIAESLKTLMGIDALKTLWRDRDQAIINLDTNFIAQDPDTHANLDFEAMEGMPQLLANLSLDAADETVLAAQYTPIVLDLGAEKVLTSGAFSGTYFNMANASDPTISGEASYDQPHQTAWLGGALLDTGSIVASTAANSTDPELQQLQPYFDTNFSHDWRRVAEDGFLVIPDSDGQVRSSHNMFGNEMVVNNNTYSNGFLALQAMTLKNCASSDLTKRYFGPWDGDLYAKTIQVWVDVNRNGIVDKGELKSLHDAGVVAINACNVVNQQETDSFGNGTSLRSAFLIQDLKVEDITTNQTEILKRLQSGLTSSGAKATFRLAIDLNFKVNTANNYFTAGAVIPTESGALSSVQLNATSNSHAKIDGANRKVASP